MNNHRPSTVIIESMDEVPMVKYIQGYYIDADGEMEVISEERPYEDYDTWADRVYSPVTLYKKEPTDD